MPISWLNSADTHFPPLDLSLPDGLLAAGGDLSPDRLLAAYQQGIFPWFNRKDPILWWSPNPRMVLFTHEINITKSLKKLLRKNNYTITIDQAFSGVMTACSKPRPNQHINDDHPTWIHPEMIKAYTLLHELGYAHSVECWNDDKLVGGLYGVSIGKIFFGESMFSTQANTSKIALVALCQRLQQYSFPLIDCQVYSDHLASLGAREIARIDFIDYLKDFCGKKTDKSCWQLSQQTADLL